MFAAFLDDLQLPLDIVIDLDQFRPDLLKPGDQLIMRIIDRDLELFRSCFFFHGRKATALTQPEQDGARQCDFFFLQQGKHFLYFLLETLQLVHVALQALCLLLQLVQMALFLRDHLGTIHRIEIDLSLDQPFICIFGTFFQCPQERADLLFLPGCQLTILCKTADLLLKLTFLFIALLDVIHQQPVLFSFPSVIFIQYPI